MTVRCILCKSSKKRVVRTGLRHGIKRKVLKCNSCGMVYLEPVENPKDYYKGKTYRKMYGPVIGKESPAQAIFDMYTPFQSQITDELEGVLKKGMSVLDVGCSAGQFLNALKGRVKTRVGLELSADHAAFVRKRLGIPVYEEPIETASIEEGPFDLITSLQVLEHVEEPVDFLKHLGKNLKKGGYLYLELPNIDDVLISEYQVPGYADFYYHEPHLSYFSKKTLARALEEAGFKGRIKTVQRYSLLNHMHWLLTGSPQGDYRLGNEMPRLASGKGKEAGALNAFVNAANEDYKRLIEKLGLGESLTFLGKKIR